MALGQAMLHFNSPQQIFIEHLLHMSGMMSGSEIQKDIASATRELTAKWEKERHLNRKLIVSERILAMGEAIRCRNREKGDSLLHTGEGN